MRGYRKVVYGLCIVVLATILLAFRLITGEIWERVIMWATAIVVGGNVLSNAAGSVAAAIGKAKEVENDQT